VPTAGKSHSA
jgi:hypothetical protein